MRCLPITLLALTGALGAQERAVLGRTGADYFPLRPGAKWTYVRTDATGTKSAVEVVCRGAAKCGRTVAFELGSSDPSGCRHEYWSGDEAGVWRHPGVGDGALRGMLALPAARWLACPPGLETRWSWDEQRPTRRPGVVLGGSPDSTRTDPRWCRAALVDVSARVSVPAGRYFAARVRLESGPADGAADECTEIWFAPGVGPVRREVFAVEEGREVLRERDDLAAVALDPAMAGDPLAAARRFVAAHPELWPSGQPALAALELPACNVAIVSRFVRAHGAAGPDLLHVAGETVTPFDPERVGDVSRFFAAESLDLRRGRPPPEPELNKFARAYFLLRAALDGVATEGTTVRQTRGGGGGGPGGRRVSGTFRYGRGDTLELAFQDATLERLVYRIR